MKMKCFLAVLPLIISLAMSAAAQARTNESRAPMQGYETGREVAAPPWSAACMSDQGPRECDEPMWVYGSPGRLSSIKAHSDLARMSDLGSREVLKTGMRTFKQLSSACRGWPGATGQRQKKLWPLHRLLRRLAADRSSRPSGSPGNAMSVFGSNMAARSMTSVRSIRAGNSFADGWSHPARCLNGCGRTGRT